MSAGFASLFFTVVMLVTTAYFLMGGLPLLVLNHDTPLDARFVRGFFNIYYKAAIIGGVGAAVSYAFWGRPLFAFGYALVALLAVVLRARLITAMSHLGEQIQTSDPGAIRSFRQVHVTALLVNLTQLVALVWGVTRISV